MNQVLLKRLKDADRDAWLEVRKELIDIIPPATQYNTREKYEDRVFKDGQRAGYLYALSLLGIEYE